MMQMRQMYIIDYLWLCREIPIMPGRKNKETRVAKIRRTSIHTSHYTFGLQTRLPAAFKKEQNAALCS